MDNTTIKKIKLFLDADDTIIKSSEAIIKILNNKYHIKPPKTPSDLKDWGYKSIYKFLTQSDVNKLFETDGFFDTVSFDEGFLEFYSQHKDKFNISIVTKGTKINIDKKQAYFDKFFEDDFEYIGMVMPNCKDDNEPWDYNKSSVDMKGGIQIDDRVDALRSTNASIKILMCRGDYYWNRPETYANIQNLYVVHDWDEISEILMFVYELHTEKITTKSKSKNKEKGYEDEKGRNTRAS